MFEHNPYQPPDDPAIRHGRIGVLISNLGTPEGTGYWPMRTYLKEFLSDRRVIETNPLLWWFILNGILLIRPSRSGRAYEKIWNRERNESPLKTITRAQTEKLSAALADLPSVIVDWGMRYGLPAMDERIKSLAERGCDRLLVFPLYPQYSAATNATAADRAFDALKTMRRQPAVRIVPAYYDHPAYIDALAQSLGDSLANLDWLPDLILASFHGLPESYCKAGDPYDRHCRTTARLLAERVRLPDGKLKVVFQSRFGRAEWLKPYAQDTVAGLPSQGVRNLVMIMPGFAADCVETLEEVAIGLGETFRDHGGVNFAAVPCLNDSPASIAMLASIVRQELSGWV